MAIKMSTGLRNELLSGDSLKAIFDAGSEIRIYGGAVPASADAAIGAATLLVVIKKDGTDGITFDTGAVNGVLQKNPSEVWEGDWLDDGTATFYRHVLTADDGSASSSAPRYQGSVGVVGADMNLTASTLTSGATQTLDYHAVALPAG